MTPKVEQWMRDAAERIAVYLKLQSTEVEVLNVIASEYSQAHPPAGESAHEDGWVSVVENELYRLAGCNLNEENCASFEVANRRIRAIARRALEALPFAPEKEKR